MRKDSILNGIKEELLAKVESITNENYSTKLDEITALVNSMKLLYPIPFENVELDDVNTEAPKTEKVLSLDTNSKIGNVYLFERKLRGGYIPDLDGGYFIPEKMVRDMEVENGDMVKIIAEHPTVDQTYYTFEIVEKSGEKHPNRVEHRFCTVEREGGLFYVTKSLGKPIRFNEIPVTFLLKDQDVRLFNLQEGDIVDIAYYKNNPTDTLKVIYKYETDDTDEPTIEQRKREFNSSQENKEDESGEDVKKLKVPNYPVDLGIFHDKKILIIGGESRHDDYKKAFEELGVELETLSGDEDSKRMEAAIKRNDVTILIIGELSHAASSLAVRICKDYDKPFDHAQSNGIQSVIMGAESAIQKGFDNGNFERKQEIA